MESIVGTLEEAVESLVVNKHHEIRYWIGLFLAVMTGIRKGEVLALRWSDIDFEGATEQIQQNQLTHEHSMMLSTDL
ncbi:tyrosine-type recombinase/integrase [Alicyclobacillus fastidiosus]|uniref:Tyrosine-type recombinase/integrase n=1 Tax=Alicyclobacillus fastidiosus TaxID=392011 RepID=A0ABV5ALF8_9BACL|nr:tyrosine-type recombinase/integrase [Alicyclobacillus fastidiosus]WEH11076.1 tyrosine-type recombinase/integrase [Alicyclobacillus fastidiosus]